ncbi:50S ribosomal protein L3 [bacterium]|nr:50S ribosomal protein L3 [bacterium]
MRGILGKKLGMTRFFDDSGSPVVATVIEAGPCTVVQVKKEENDGYNAVQLGYLEQMEKRVTKPLIGHFNKAGVSPFKVLREIRDFDEEVKAGDVIQVDQFSEGDIVKVTGVSKGHGFTGVVKRHGFGGGPKSHGQSDRHRAPGSIGQSAYPKRVFKGMRMGGRMGNKKHTIRNMKIVKIVPEKNLIYVHGAVPGARNSLVEVYC